MLSPAPVMCSRSPVARDPSPVPRDGVPRDLDTIKAGLLFPALVRCLYLPPIWKAEHTNIFYS